MNFYTSDSHFYHKAVIWMCKRPFNDIEDMNSTLIKNWNEKVTTEDTVYYLGDLSHKASRGAVKKVLEQLNGKIVFIKGNHDKEKDVIALSSRFKTVDKLLEIKDEFINRNIVMCHYPMESWRGSNRGSYHLHGHCHGSSYLTNLNQYLRIDVGVDCQNFFPISSLEVEEIMKTKEYYSKYYI